MKSTSFTTIVILSLVSAVFARHPPRIPGTPADKLAPLEIKDASYFGPSSPADDSRGTYKISNGGKYCFDLRGSVKEAFPSSPNIRVQIVGKRRRKQEVVYYKIESPLCNEGLAQAPESLGCVSAAHNEGTISGCLDLGSNMARPRRSLGTARIEFLEPVQNSTFFSAEGTIMFDKQR
ncbi:MAG: hypothetical protein J3Q66DRAFT_349982 [Benniella sp.]|nr:MAG: hypothetical protein J3Q66DRAFT_349982 [Benniella sp.]